MAGWQAEVRWGEKHIVGLLTPRYFTSKISLQQLKKESARQAYRKPKFAYLYADVNLFYRPCRTEHVDRNIPGLTEPVAPVAGLLIL